MDRTLTEDDTDGELSDSTLSGDEPGIIVMAEVKGLNKRPTHSSSSDDENIGQYKVSPKGKNPKLDNV